MKTILILHNESPESKELTEAIEKLKSFNIAEIFTEQYDKEIIEPQQYFGEFYWIIFYKPNNNQLYTINKLKLSAKTLFIIDPSKLTYNDLASVKDDGITILSSWEAFFTHNFL